MKKFLFFISFFVAFAVAANAQSAGSASGSSKSSTTAVSQDVKVKKGEKVVLIKANVECNSCKAKVEKNIAFVKGVKDVSADVEKRMITISYDPKKVTEETLLKEVQKLGMGGEIVKGCVGNCKDGCKSSGCKSEGSNCAGAADKKCSEKCSGHKHGEGDSCCGRDKKDDKSTATAPTKK